MSEEKELKPCPFCGGEATTAEHEGDWVVFCIMRDCLVEPCTPYYDTEEEAIRAWNTRYQPDTKKEV